MNTINPPILTPPTLSPKIPSYKVLSQVKRPDLLPLIAIWQFFTAFGALTGIGAIAVFAFPGVVAEVFGQAIVGAVFGLSLAVLVLLLYIGLAVTGGIGLLKGREWGRILGIIHAALALSLIPIGTVIGVLSLIYLTKDEVRGYFAGSIQK